MAKPKKKKPSGQKIICQNKKAGHNYFLEDRMEAGMVLQGTEVKSLRLGKGSLNDSYATISKGELFLYHFHIPEYSHGNIYNHDPIRKRKLLMHHYEINKLIGKIKEKGYSLVPTKVYFKNGVAKIEVALAKGKAKGDKRQALKKKEADRTIARALRQSKK